MLFAFLYKVILFCNSWTKQKKKNCRIETIRSSRCFFRNEDDRGRWQNREPAARWRKVTTLQRSLNLVTLERCWLACMTQRTDPSQRTEAEPSPPEGNPLCWGATGRLDVIRTDPDSDELHPQSSWDCVSASLDAEHCLALINGPARCSRQFGSIRNWNALGLIRPTQPSTLSW